MMMYHYKLRFKRVILLFLPAFIVVNSIRAEEQQDTIRAVNDTINYDKAQRDSILIESLMIEVQELKLNEILIREEFEQKNKAGFVADSIQRAERRRSIDSLRNIFAGDPVIIEGDTLFKLYAKKGGVLPAQRAKTIGEKIMRLGKRLSLATDSIYILDTEYFSEIMNGDEVIISVTDNDALWQNTTRQELAAQYLPVIEDKIKELQDIYGLREKIKGTLLTILIAVIQTVLIYFTVRLFRLVKRRIVSGLANQKFKPLVVKGYEFLSPVRQTQWLIVILRLLMYVVIMIQLIITIPILFSIFPETEDLSRRIFSYILNPLRSYWKGFVKFLPDLIKIIVLILIFRYIMKGLKYIANEITSSKLKITGFYPDWAMTTYQIVRIILYVFLAILIWPLIPNSDTEIFTGVSVFIGLIVSLGSTSVIANLMAGLVITFMRSFTIGDQIKMNDITGTVIEKTPFVTRIRTLKNEVVTIPNSLLMSSQTINYSISAKDSGIIIHSDINIAYDVPWRQAEKLLISAAQKTPGVLSSPKPFVLTRELADPYCIFQINAYTKESVALPRVYSNLHQQIIDHFNEAGIEIMLPTYHSVRDGNEPVMPPEYLHRKKKQEPKTGETENPGNTGEEA